MVVFGRDVQRPVFSFSSDWQDPKEDRSLVWFNLRIELDPDAFQVDLCVAGLHAHFWFMFIRMNE